MFSLRTSPYLQQSEHSIDIPFKDGALTGVLCLLLSTWVSALAEESQFIWDMSTIECIPVSMTWGNDKQNALPMHGGEMFLFSQNRERGASMSHLQYGVSVIRRIGASRSQHDDYVWGRVKTVDNSLNKSTEMVSWNNCAIPLEVKLNTVLISGEGLASNISRRHSNQATTVSYLGVAYRFWLTRGRLTDGT